MNLAFYLQQFVNDCLENRQENGYPNNESAIEMAEDICHLVKGAEQINPQLLVPFIEEWQTKKREEGNV